MNQNTSKMEQFTSAFKKFKSITSAFILLFLSLTSCKKETNMNPDPAADIKINGYWIITENITGNCNGSQETEIKTKVYEIDQDGKNLNIIIYPALDTIQGQINQNEVRWEGTIPSGSGLLDINYSGTVLSNGTQGTGTADWLWYSDTYSCSGTTEISAEKVYQETADFEGTWNGNWQSDEDDINGTFTADVIQNDTVLGGTIEVPEIGLNTTNLRGFVTGNVVFFGDINQEIVYVGIINKNTGTGSYDYSEYSNEGNWTAERMK